MLPSLQLLAATPVVDIDGTLFVQGGIFIVLWIVLRPLLFEPWLAAQDRRKESIDGALELAAEMRGEADELGRSYDAKLEAAREHANGLRSTAYREEETRQAEKLAKSRAEAQAELERERKRLAGEAATARAGLASRIDQLADDIARRLLGRAA